MLQKQKRLPRFSRQPEAAAKAQITEITLAIIDTIKRHRLISTSVLKPLIQRNPRVIYRHLRQLFDRAVVNRFPLLTPQGLAGEFAYYLDSPKALELLSSFRGIKFEPGEYQAVARNRERWKDNRRLFADHELMISRFRALLELACRASNGKYELKDFQQGARLYRTVLVPDLAELGRAVEMPLRPDALFALRNTETQNTLHYFYEADRGTEDTGRIMDKMRAYYHLIVKYKKGREAYGAQRVRAVLFETTSIHWADVLRGVATRPQVSNRPSQLFWFTSGEFFTRPVEIGQGSSVPAFHAFPEMLFDTRFVCPADNTIHSLTESL
jgi:hypothetical protein